MEKTNLKNLQMFFFLTSRVSIYTYKDLFLIVISPLNLIGVQFDKSSKELNKILQKVPNHDDGSIKSEIKREIRMLKKAKRALDVLEKEQEHNNGDLNRSQKNMGNCRLNTRKHTKVQEHCNSLKQKRKKLKTDIIEQKEKYQQAQKQYRTNTENIYQRSEKKEVDRLQNMSEPLWNFIEALKIDPALLAEAIQKQISSHGKQNIVLHPFKKHQFNSNVLYIFFLC
jgi:chromosome segregation ATPase